MNPLGTRKIEVPITQVLTLFVEDSNEDGRLYYFVSLHG